MSYAFVFPGQGSQRVGMLSDLANAHADILTTFAEASDVLGYDLWDLVQNGPEDKLNSTMYTQPALLAAGVAVWRVLEKQSVCQPALLAGHSLGEYTALVCSGSLAMTDAVQLVALRGQYMQEAVKPGEGAMAAIIGLEPDDVRAICESVVSEHAGVLSPANYNSIGQIVIAGETALVEKACALAKDKGAKRALVLPVSVPSHCELMRSAAEKLAAKLEEININGPTIPVISNVAVAPYTDARSIQKGLVEQLYSPVRWIETIQYFVAKGVSSVIECGPEKVLSGLNKRIDKSLELLSTSDVNGLDAVHAFLAEKQTV